MRNAVITLVVLAVLWLWGGGLKQQAAQHTHKPAAHTAVVHRATPTPAR